MTPGSFVTLALSGELFRIETCTIACSIVANGAETPLACTAASLPVPTSLVIQDPCSSATCSATSLYTLRLRNLVNKLTAEPFSGNLTLTTTLSVQTTLVGQTIFNMSSIPALQPGVLQNVSVNRSMSFQGQASNFTLSFSTPGYLLQGSIVELWLPLNQIVVSPNSTDYQVITPGTLTLAQAGTSNTSYLIYSATEWLCNPGSSSNKCDSGLNYNLTIGNASNPFIQSTVYNSFVINIKASDTSYSIF